MLSSDDYALKRLQLDYDNIRVYLAVFSLMLELASRNQAQANPGSSWSTEVDNTAGSEPQLKEDCPDADMSFDQTSEEDAFAPSPEA
jgi:hypothetical protein